MYIKSNPFYYLSAFLLTLFFSGLHLTTFANENDLLPVQQNRKLLKLNGSVSSMLEQKWVLKKDTAIYNTTAHVTLDDGYIMVRSEEASFDKIGNILHLKTVTLVNAKDNITKDSLRYFYYKDDKIMGISNLLENKKYDSMIFHYQKKGNLEYYKSLDINNGIQYKMAYTYLDKQIATIEKEDAKGNVLSTIQLKYKGAALSQSQVFDENNALIETRRFATRKNNDGNTEESYAGSDAKGNMKGGLVVVKDANGNVLEQNIVDADRNISENYHFQYDADNNRIDAKILTGTQSVHIEYRYTYDEHHNWTKKETFTNDILTSILTRKLNYGG